MNFNTDYYAILGVMPTAEEVVIRAAYKALAQRYHPDRFNGSPEELHRKMSEINEAYDVLSDQNKRKEYDQHRARVSEGGAYFDENSNESPPAYDPLEQDWKTAISYYPDLERIEANLAQISWRLAYAYRASLLETKSFSQRDKIASMLEKNFLESYFGKNQRIVEFARKLIFQGQKKAARELNKAVCFFGDELNAEIVITKINKDFNDPAGEIKEKEGYKRKQEKEMQGNQYYSTYSKPDELYESRNNIFGVDLFIGAIKVFLIPIFAGLFIVFITLIAGIFSVSLK
jgi:curved DNA-binding protein CbpA